MGNSTMQHMQSLFRLSTLAGIGNIGFPGRWGETSICCSLYRNNSQFRGFHNSALKKVALMCCCLWHVARRLDRYHSITNSLEHAQPNSISWDIYMGLKLEGKPSYYNICSPLLWFRYGYIGYRSLRTFSASLDVVFQEGFPAGEQEIYNFGTITA